MWRSGRIMRLIHRVADKPIQFPRGHRGSQVRLIAAAHLKGSPKQPCWGDRAAYEAISQTRCRLVERKGIFLRARVAILQISSSWLIAVHRPAAINYPDEQPIKCDKSSALLGPETRFPPSNGLGTNGKSDYAIVSMRGEIDSPSFW